MRKRLASKRKKLVSRIVSAVLGCYVLLLLFPQFLFGQRIDYRGFRIYAHQPLDRGIYALLDSAERLLRSSELYSQRPRQIQVLLTDGFVEFAFLQPGAFAAFAATNPFTRRIVLSRTDIHGNRIYRNGAESPVRRLHSTLAHEVTHVLLLEHLGLVRFLSLERWKNEGYCDYIANESSHDLEDGIRKLCSGAAVRSASFDYFRYRLYVGYLIREQKQSMQAIIRSDYPEDELLAAVRRSYCQ